MRQHERVYEQAPTSVERAKRARAVADAYREAVAAKREEMLRSGNVDIDAAEAREIEAVGRAARLHIIKLRILE